MTGEEIKVTDDNCVKELEQKNFEEGERLIMLPNTIDYFICTKATISQQIAEKKAKRLATQKKRHSVPDHYVKDFGLIFEKDQFD
jgi:protein associated with RNAse G/E